MSNLEMAQSKTGWNMTIINILFFEPFLAFISALSKNNNSRALVRICIYILIILLGLTAITPEWLDLKDMMIIDYRMRITHSLNQIQHSISSTLHIPESTLSIPENLFSSIHKTILEPIHPKPSFNGLLGNLGELIWRIMAFGIYVVFILGFLVVYWSSNKLFRMSIGSIKLAKKYIIPLHLVIFVSSLSLSLVIWSYIDL